MSGARVQRRGAATRASSIDWPAIEALGATRFVSDSRQVVRGDTFVAYPGGARDGRGFIADAIGRGAASVIWEKRDFAWRRAWKVKNVPVENLRRHAGEIAAEVYGHPS